MLAFAPLDGAVGAAATVVSALASAVAPLAGTAATATAIVLFTVAVRLLVSPLTWAQVRGERRRAVLAPRIRELQQRYGKEPARLSAELSALYREAGASPLAGCLPGLLQAPFFFVMYRLFTTTGPASGGGLLTERLAGVPLGHHVGDGLAGAAGPLYAVLFTLLAALAWLSSRRMRRAAAAAQSDPAGAIAPASAGRANVGGKARAVGVEAAGSAGAGSAAGELPGAGLLARIMPLLPYLTLLAALVVPLAAVLYLVTTTAWTALEQAVLRRPQASIGVDIARPGPYNS